MEQHLEELTDMALTRAETQEHLMVTITAVLEAEEEAEDQEAILDVRTRLVLTSSATSVQTASTTANCSATRWRCRTSTVSLGAVAETAGGPRRGATWSPNAPRS